MTLIALFKVIPSIYLQCVTKLMASKEVVKKKYKNELRNQSLVIERMVPDYPSTELRQSSEKTKQEKIIIPRITFLKIWNCNQKSTISNLNRSSKD